jgi:iron complex transport system substrate-binding protein
MLRLCLLIPVLILASCGSNEVTRPGGGVSAVNAIKVAGRLSIEKEEGFTRITIKNPWQGAVNVNITYFLVRRGSAVPDGVDSSRVIFVPVRKIVCMSTTHIAMLEALGAEQSLSGMSGTRYIYSPVLRSLVDKGLIKDVGYETNLNKEQIVNIMPDVTMIYGVGSESAGYIGKIQEMGIKVLYNADYLETNPLGKAEWIKLFGALYCMEGKADSIFSAESEAYNKLKSYVAGKITSRPKVLLGLPFKDTWFVSPGNSFISRLIDDAGGDYLWKDTESAVSMPLGLENVWLRALKADYWINVGTVKKMSDVTAVDQRLSQLQCFLKGYVYNNNNRISPEGGNDFWESGTVFPHIILNDVASILHPELFQGYEMYYYRKVN